MRTDDRLIEGVLRKDRKALEELYDRYNLLLWRIVSRSVADQTVCEQLVTQVFKQVWKNPQEFGDKRRLALLLVECCREKIQNMPE